MMKNNFSFNELKNNLKDNYPHIIYNKKYSNFGTQMYQYNSNHISISLESFYGDADIEYVPSGTSKIKCTNTYIDNEENMHISLEKEIALHGFSYVPFIIQSIINETCDDILYDEFVNLLIDKNGIEFIPGENGDKFVFNLNNKNHKMGMYINKNTLPFVKTYYSKSGSASWYNIFNTRILNDNFDNYYNTKNMKFCTKSGINLSTIYNIINEIYNNIEQEVPFRPKRKDCDKLFEYYLENDINTIIKENIK